MKFEPFKMWEDIKKLAEISEDLRDELEVEELKVQNVVSDVGYKYWVHIKPVLEFGEGEINKPDFTLIATEEWWIKMLNKEIRGREAYMQGNLIIEGNFSRALAYASLLSIVNEIKEE